MPDMNENAETQQEYFGKAKLETDYKDLSMRLYNRIAELEKENADLKKQVEELKDEIATRNGKLAILISEKENIEE